MTSMNMLTAAVVVSIKHITPNYRFKHIKKEAESLLAYKAKKEMVFCTTLQ